MWGQLWYCLPIAQLGNLAGGGPQGGVKCHQTPLSSLPKIQAGWGSRQQREAAISCELLNFISCTGLLHHASPPAWDQVELEI